VFLHFFGSNVPTTVIAKLVTGGLMGAKKQIVFYSDGKIRAEDTVADPDGETSIPEKGQIIKKHGQHGE
jgi:hypothetical protein